MTPFRRRALRLSGRTAILIAAGFVPILDGCSNVGGSYRPHNLSIRITYRDSTHAHFPYAPIPLEIGQQRKLLIRAYAYLGEGGDVSCAPLEWSTDHPHIASVAEHGTITGLRRGETTVRVRADCGATYGERVVENAVEVEDPAAGSSTRRSPSGT